MENQLQVTNHGITKLPEPSRLEAFTASLNHDPKKEWLQKTPDGKAEYIPIGIIEMELRKDFMGLVKFNVISERRELNEYIVVGRITVFHPVLMQWLEYDGIGAKVITQKANTSLNDFTEHKIKNALEMNAPNAYAESIKNAAKKIGKKYGSDINRKFEDSYEAKYSNEAEINDVKNEVEMALKACLNLADLTLLWDTYSSLHENPEFKRMFTARKVALKANA